MRTKAIIVDDEKMARVLLKGLIERYCPEIEVVEQCVDLPSAVKAIIKHQPELVFLDIEMPGHSGLELLDFFDEQSNSFSIIFTTAYNQYAIKAFKLSAVDYLLKPIDSKDLQNAVELYKKQKNRENNYRALRENMKAEIKEQKIAISSLNSVKYLPIADIALLKADGAYTTLYLSNGQQITTSKGLKHYEELLAQHKQFMRSHKSFIINLTKVTEYLRANGGVVIIDGVHNASVSVDKAAELNARLSEFIKFN